jgi:hypothetical protein
MFQDWHHIFVCTKLALVAAWLLYRGFKWIKADVEKTPLPPRSH